MPKVSLQDEYVDDEIENTMNEEPEENDEDVKSEDIEDDELNAFKVEEMDPNEELWPDGPPAGQIVAWKEQYGDVFVSSITPEDHVVWRTMNRFEYKQHIRHMEQVGATGQYTQAEAALLNEESVCEICVLYPPFNRENIPSELAGMPSAIAQDILEASGFVALEVRKL